MRIFLFLMPIDNGWIIKMIEDREYQDRTIETALPILVQYGIVILNMECRTGKTFTSLKLASKVNPKSVLFITPKSAFMTVKEDIEKFKPKFSVDVINIESLHKMNGTYDLVIFDEYHNLRYTQKPKVKNQKFKPFSNIPRICLTGTLFPEGFASAYSLFEKEFKEYENFYKWFSDFGIKEERYFGRRKAVIYEKTHKKKIFNRINKYIISVTQEDAGFNQFAQEKIHIVKSYKVDSACRILKEDKMIKYSGDAEDIYVADSIAKEFSAVCQMQGGTLKISEENFLIIDTYKVDYIANNFSGKVAIYYKYKADLEMIRNNMPKSWKCCMTVKEFEQADGDCYFPGQFRSKREGVTLDFCNNLVFYGMPHSNLDYLQSKERMLTKNKEDESVVHFLITEFENDIYNTVKYDKGKFNSESYKQWRKRNTSWKKIFSQMLSVF